MAGDPIKIAPSETHSSMFWIWFATLETRVEEEALVYPLASLVAEFGGTLSLFLGTVPKVCSQKTFFF